MTSSMLAGERRWASARRGGMTVLGKVAVPKPLNLPSQRLENHGLDPNVTILPKGTLSWGSRSSSSASNAWSSSTLSANADGSTGSRTRPSSGGSGTRPSTAGSDRTHESAWGPHSRPSSASGALTSNQTSLASLRPRSAETRPGSSQLSRFAETSSEKSVAWGPSSAAEKLGVSSSKNDGFSLSSGDFPSLGLERDNAGKNADSQDHGSHGRPSSSSGRLAQAKEKALTSQAALDVKSGTANDWRRDGSQCNGDGFQPSNEKWQGEPQHYLNANIPPQHFDAWHGPPVNAPVGVWFRGPPGGPPYGTPVAPGGFPVEPFPYYRPQIPPSDLANFQPAPPPGAGPRGHHPTNGDIYRPQMSDAYIRPGMPIRPGFYAGPMAYEGYYGPPMGYYNPNEQDIPFMGMAAGPSVYNRYPAPNVPDPSHSHARAGGHVSSGKPLLPVHMESVHSDETRGPYKVLMKQQNEWDGKEKEVNQQQNVPTNASCLEKGDQSRTSLRKTEWGADHIREEEMFSRTKFGENTSSRTFDSRGDYSSDPVKVKSPEMDNMKSVDSSWRKKSEISASSPGVPQVLPATCKDSSLIQKIEGLNAKVRASDGQHDVGPSSNREVQKNRLHDVNSKDEISMIEAGAATTHEITHAVGNLIPTIHKAGVSAGDKNFPLTAASGTAISRRPHDVQGRVDHRGKGRFNTRDPDEWRKKPLGAQSSSVVSSANVGHTSSLQAKDLHASAEAADKLEITIPAKDEEESLTPVFDPSDCQAQRIKMREFAKQRAIQLQKEEEERIREQKARALAKLEELNRRTHVGDGLTQKLEKAPSSIAIQQEQDEPKIIAEPKFVVASYGPSSADLISNPNVVAPVSESSSNDVKESSVLSGNALLETPKNGQQELVPHDKPLPLRQDVHNAIPSDSKAASQVNGGSVSRHKHTGYKHKQNIPSERNFTEKLISISTAEAPKVHIDVAVDNVVSTDVSLEVGSSGESSLPSNSNTMVESSVHQRRKNSKIGKNKLKLDGTLCVVDLPSVPNETANVNAASDSGEPKASHSVLDHSSVQSVTDAKDSMQPSQQSSSLPSEEAPGRPNNQWKSQHSRRMPRNPQANKFLDKFHSSDAVVWAPVRSQNKSEAVDEASQKIVTDAVTPTAKSDHSVQNNLKNKRAEMERYVPKPVAKELAQHGSIPQPVSSSSSPTTCDETAGRAESGSQSASAAIGNVGSTVESRNGDKQNKPGKAHGAWRQRNSVEASHVQGLQHGSASTSNHSKNIQKSIVHPSDLKSEENSIKAQPKCSDEWNTCDGWNIPDTSDASQPVSSPVVINQGVNVKGTRHPFRGHSSTGNSHSISGGETNKSYGHSAALEIRQSDTIDTTKENRGVGERTSSQWQPKSQAYSANNQWGGRARKGQNVSAEVGRAIKKDSFSQGRVHLPPQHDNESSEVVVQPQPDQSMSENNVCEAPNVEHQEARRQRKAASSRGQPYTPNQGRPVSRDEEIPASGDTRHEQHFSSGLVKNGNQNNRSGRGHESRGDWSYAGQDNRQHDMPANWERSRHNSHYEYQPVGPNNNSKSSNFEGPRDGFHNPGSRYRERGQNFSKRGGGNFYGGKVAPSE